MVIAYVFNKTFYKSMQMYGVIYMYARVSADCS